MNSSKRGNDSYLYLGSCGISCVVFDNAARLTTQLLRQRLAMLIAASLSADGDSPLLVQTKGSIDIHVDRFGPDLIHSPSSVGVFGAEMAV